MPDVTALKATKSAPATMREQARQRRLAGAGRAPEDHRVQRAAVERLPQRPARAEQVRLSDELVERARTHPLGQRRARQRRVVVGEERAAHRSIRSRPLAPRFEEDERRGDRDVQRVDAGSHRNRQPHVGLCDGAGREAGAFVTEQHENRRRRGRPASIGVAAGGDGRGDAHAGGARLGAGLRRRCRGRAARETCCPCAAQRFPAVGSAVPSSARTPVAPERIGAADDAADVARILHADEPDHERGASAQTRSRGRRPPLGDGDDAARRPHRAGGFEHRRRAVVARRRRRRAPAATTAERRPSVSTRVDAARRRRAHRQSGVRRRAAPIDRRRRDRDASWRNRCTTGADGSSACEHAAPRAVLESSVSLNFGR